MASNPPALLPQSFLDRVRSGARSLIGWGGEAPMAQPLAEELEPARDASPDDEAAKPEPGAVYSRAFGGFSIDGRWLQQLALNDDTILQREGGHDLKLYEAVLDDDVAASAFQQRRLAVISRPWEVEPGDDSAQAKAAAEHLREQLNRIPWDKICDRMLFGRWFGYAVAEAIYEIGPDGKIWLEDILVPDRKWFGFSNAGELRLKTSDNPSGEALPPNKFWAYRAGASHDFTPYGVGLAHWCYWPVWFKRNVIKFWAVYLEKFGMPTALAKFPIGSTQEVIDNSLAAAAAVGRDAAVAVPTDVELTLLAEGRSSGDSYEQFIGEMNDALLRVILSQTGTSKSEAQGLGGSQSEVMKDVRDEVVRADSDMLHESFNATIARWLTAWNFGPNVAPPKLYRTLEDQEDINSIVERDVKLKGLGWRRTEESAREIYGEGYELAEPEPQPGQEQLPGGGPNIIDLEEERKKRAEFAADGPRPLYVYRPLLPASGRKLLAWAAEQGIPNRLPLEELHTTVLYSKAAVDWFQMGDAFGGSEKLRVVPGGPRAIIRYGEAIVLRFASSDLSWRHESMVRDGASHDYSDFAPHVTIAYAPEDAFDVDALEEAFQGELLFGPEIFEPIDEDWAERFKSKEFSAEELDQIQRFANRLAEESEPVIAEFAASLKNNLEGIRDVDALRIALLEGLERFPAAKLAELTGLPFVAVRASAEAGVERSVKL